MPTHRTAEGMENKRRHRLAYYRASQSCVAWMMEHHAGPYEVLVGEVDPTLAAHWRRNAIQYAVVRWVRENHPQVWHEFYAAETADIPPLPLGRPFGS